eukprot:TRINITY_DN27647_c0_g3_i1.p1 TRINITY_DN27647_c0_g3~~TRINITY_DN27647_c0_g3_i1.p1  ORF type:complete len:373 (+),score=93.69 TRINITY_DN27647_c0_g3_i1:62-1180(+)
MADAGAGLGLDAHADAYFESSTAVPVPLLRVCRFAGEDAGGALVTDRSERQSCCMSSASSQSAWEVVAGDEAEEEDADVDAASIEDSCRAEAAAPASFRLEDDISLMGAADGSARPPAKATSCQRAARYDARRQGEQMEDAARRQSQLQSLLALSVSAASLMLMWRTSQKVEQRCRSQISAARKDLMAAHGRLFEKLATLEGNLSRVHHALQDKCASKEEQARLAEDLASMQRQLVDVPQQLLREGREAKSELLREFDEKWDLTMLEMRQRLLQDAEVHRDLQGSLDKLELRVVDIDERLVSLVQKQEETSASEESSCVAPLEKRIDDIKQRFSIFERSTEGRFRYLNGRRLRVLGNFCEGWWVRFPTLSRL